MARLLRSRSSIPARRDSASHSGHFRANAASIVFRQSLERQDEVWKVADRTISREASLDVSLILAFAPEDLVAAGK